jgi:hypothetical protein
LTDYLDEVYRILDSAKTEKAELRVLGSTAFRIHCQRNKDLFESLKRELTDIDLAASGKDRKKVKSIFQSLDYEIDQRILMEAEGSRFFFRNPSKGVEADVFFDKLEMCHVIPFKDRLSFDYPTVPLAELLLEKMQIVKINEKDIKDTAVLLLEHEVGSGDREKIDLNYIASLLSDDWGFYYTVTTNLTKVKTFLSSGTLLAALTAEQKQRISTNIDTLQKSIEDAAKTWRWKFRAKVGPSKQWYNDVGLDKRTAF